MSYITEVYAREVLDSKGMPTVEAEVYLESGSYGRAIVPAGINGTLEASENRDNDKRRYNGFGVLNAVDVINKDIAKILIGEDSRDQIKIDKKMLTADGTLNKSKFGANTMLAVSIAVAKAASDYSALPLYQYLGGFSSSTLPIPVITILNSVNNLHGVGIIPIGVSTIKEAIRMGSEINTQFKKLLTLNSVEYNLSENGALKVLNKTTEEILNVLLQAINNLGYSINRDVKLFIDSRASLVYEKETKKYNVEGNLLSGIELVDYYSNLVEKYNVIMIEDPFNSDDTNSYKKLMQKLAKKVDIVGDELLQGNQRRIDKALNDKLINTITIKPNQIGTLSETVELIEKIKRSGNEVIISTRLADTEDSFISDLSVAMNTKYIKIGSLFGSEKISKYNQLIRIEDTLGSSAKYFKR